MITALSSQEQIRLHQQEERITGAFYETGQALAIIRDERLYRANYKTFEEYCNDRWQFNRDYASKLIRAAESASILYSNGIQQNNLPSNERVIRPLTDLPAEQQPEAWEAASKIASNNKPNSFHTARAASAARFKAEAPTVGAKVRIMDETSQHYGREAEIINTVNNGIILECQVEGVVLPVPVLCNEVAIEQPDEDEQPYIPPKAVETAAPPQEKINPIASLSSRLEIAEMRNQVLEECLAGLIDAIESGQGQETLMQLAANAKKLI